MINKQTILSLYNDKLTLMQWLKKVEVALKDATANAFVVNKKGEATISFSIHFEDGTSLESGDIVLQQGESVTSARISSGHLILTLTNGDELDAGDVGAVSGFSIDANQHLIVTYQNGSKNDLGAIFQGNVNIDGNLTASGTIDGAVVTGNEIVEKMDNYSFEAGSDARLNVVYAGAVKTGNKLTLVIFGSFTQDAGETQGNLLLGTFYLPASVLAKLYPYQVGSLTNVLDNKIIPFIDTNISHTNLMCRIEKGSTSTNFKIANATALADATTFLFRYECTFLLSDNLASE